MQTCTTSTAAAHFEVLLKNALQVPLDIERPNVMLHALWNAVLNVNLYGGGRAIILGLQEDVHGEGHAGFVLHALRVGVAAQCEVPAVIADGALDAGAQLQQRPVLVLVPHQNPHVLR